MAFWEVSKNPSLKKKKINSKIHQNVGKIQDGKTWWGNT